MKTTKWPYTDKYNYHYCTSGSNIYNLIKIRNDTKKFNSFFSCLVPLTPNISFRSPFLCNMATSCQINGSFLTNLSDAEALRSAFNLSSLYKASSPESIQQILDFDEHSKTTSTGKTNVCNVFTCLYNISINLDSTLEEKLRNYFNSSKFNKILL